jgi:hypothetical protein
MSEEQMRMVEQRTVMREVRRKEFLGKAKDPWGNARWGFHATTRINRKDYGLAWNEVIEGGGLLVGDDVDISLDVGGAIGHALTAGEPARETPPFRG